MRPNNPRPLNRRFSMRVIKRRVPAIAAILGFVFLAGPAASDDHALPFKATPIIIELTDNDIELQVFVDGNNWKTLQIVAPDDRTIFHLETQNILRRQGMSELHFASEPSDFPVDDVGEIDPIDAEGTVLAFLERFPAGAYEVEAWSPDGELEGTAYLTHVLPALPEILAPVSDDDDTPLVDPDNLVIEWEEVTTRFLPRGRKSRLPRGRPIEIIEYQVILDQVDPLRVSPWIDGSNRRALINLPASATSLTVPPEFLLPNTLYDFEVLAIEASGNSTITEGEFMTE